MIKKITLALSLSIASFAANQPLTVDNLIELALTNSPDINISRSNFQAAEQRTKYATGNYLPRLDAIANGGAQGSKLKNESYDNTDVFSGTLSASQLLFDFGKTTGDIGAFSEEANASNATLHQVISNKIFNVKQDYFRLLRVRSLIRVNEENVDLNEKQLHRSKRYFEAGIRTKVDVTDAQVRLIEAQLDLQNVKYDLQLSHVALEKTVGIMPYAGSYTVYEKELKLPYLYDTLPLVEHALIDLEKYAYEHRYELKQYGHLIKSAKSRVTSVQGDYYPALYVKGDYMMQNVDDATALVTPEQQWQAMINLEWNLFAGLQTKASSQEARINVNKVSSEFANTKLAIKQETDNAYISVFKNKDAVKLSESLVEAASEKFGQVQKRYEHGLSDYIELQEARQGYINAQSSLVITYYDYYIAMAELDRAVGR